LAELQKQALHESLTFISPAALMHDHIRVHRKSSTGIVLHKLTVYDTKSMQQSSSHRATSTIMFGLPVTLIHGIDLWQAWLQSGAWCQLVMQADKAASTHEGLQGIGP